MTPERVRQTEAAIMRDGESPQRRDPSLQSPSAQIDFLCTNDHVASRFTAVNSGPNGFTSALIHPDTSDNPLAATLLVFLLFYFIFWKEQVFFVVIFF